MRLSRKTISKHWWKFLGFLFVLGLVNLAGLMACCVGVFVTLPVSLAALMYAYEDIFNPPGLPSAPPPGSGAPGADGRAQPGGSGGAWKVVAVIVAGLMLLLAIPIGAILLAIGWKYQTVQDRQRTQARTQFGQAYQQAPTFVVRGTVTDAATGRPIAGARVDDSFYGARPARPPQQTLTDAQGHYELHTAFEDHPLAVSAPGYDSRRYTFLTSRLRPGQPAQIDFQLRPAQAVEAAAFRPELAALDETVRRGNQAWSRGDYSQALALLLPAAQTGHPIAQHRLGVMYARGQGVEKDFAEATRWFRQAAEQGQGESQYSMGLRYFWGQGVAQDDQESVRWLKLAADQGVDLAAAALKNRYALGVGVPPDLVEAYKWGLVAGAQADSTTKEDITLADLAAKLTPDELAEAQRRAREFVPKQTLPADLP